MRLATVAPLLVVVSPGNGWKDPGAVSNKETIRPSPVDFANAGPGAVSVIERRGKGLLLLLRLNEFVGQFAHGARLNPPARL